MRTGKELIIATKEFAKDDPSQSWKKVITSAILLVIAFSLCLSPISIWLKLPISIITGLLMVRFFVIYHDHQHYAILSRSKLADILMRYWGIFAITPSSIWRHSHNHHHNHNSKLRSAHIGSYPIMTKERYLKASPKERKQYLAMRHPLTIFNGYFTIFLTGMCIVPLVQNFKQHKDAAYALTLHIILYLLLGSILGASAVIFALFIPFYVACAAGSYLFYAQHNFPEVQFKENDGWTYEGAALESSSFCKMSPIMHFFTANIGYHHIHHLNAKIPFYRLPEAFKAMPELQQPKTTSLSPLEVIRCLRLKVWDSEQKRMVPLSEIKPALT